MHFVPQFPPRPPKVLRPLRLLRPARRKLVAIRPTDTFGGDFFSHTLLRQSIFPRNSPGVVKQAFVDDAADFHARSPRQRPALEPLIRDGLFIRDDKVRRERRDRVAPLTHISRLPDFPPRWHSAQARRGALLIRTVTGELPSRAERADAEVSLARGMAAEQGGGLDPDAIRNETAVLFMPGHETTVSTLTWAWCLFSQDCETEARLHVEVDSPDGQPIYVDLPRLRFTQAGIEDTPRVFPPVPIKASVSAQIRRIEGRNRPAGALVVLVPRLPRGHQNYLTEPDGFVPDRSMSAAEATPNRYDHVPFRVGPRICTRAAFRLTKAARCLATIAQQFRLRPA
jgi:cytochrome P450